MNLSSLPLQLAFFLGLAIFAGWMLLQMRQARATQERLIDLLNADAGNAWFRVNLARPAHFTQHFKLLGFEARGLLINEAEQIRVLAELPDGERIDRCFAKQTLELRWLGNQGVASRNLYWIALGAGDDELRLAADTGLNALPSRQALADICRIIQPQVALPESAVSDFALETHPASRSCVLLFVALLALALLDGVLLNQHELLRVGAAGVGMPAMMLAALPIHLWLSCCKVPGRESMGLALLVGIAAMLAYLPAAKRLDQFLGGPAKTHEYRLSENAVFEALDPAAPTLRLRAHPYWKQFEPGSVHTFELLNGPLGLWQLDPASLDARLLQFERSVNIAVP